MRKSLLTAQITVVFLVTFLFALVASAHFFVQRDSSAAEATTPVDINVTLEQVMSINLDTGEAGGASLTIPITPKDGGQLEQKDLHINIATNNQTGYKLTMHSKTEDTNLVRSTPTNATIPSTTAPVSTPAALTPNHWGYSLWADSQVTPPTTFVRIPPLSTPDTLKTTDAPATTSDTHLTFAVNLNLLQPEGTYTNIIVFTATPNYIPTGQDLGAMQKLTRENCPTERARAYDARNGQYYFVQKIPGSGAGGVDLCWMESNLMYSGGGTWDSSAGYPDDRKTITQRLTGQGDGLTPEFMDPQGNPEFSAEGPGTPTTPAFYGYLYNWCAAMGGQATACQTDSGTQPSVTISICPAGWRLPRGGMVASTNDRAALNSAVNEGSTNSDAGLISNWLGVYSGYYVSSLAGRGTEGRYWTSTTETIIGTAASFFEHGANYVTASTGSSAKWTGLAVRCVL